MGGGGRAVCKRGLIHTTLLLLVLVSVMMNLNLLPSQACPSDGSECSSCILNRMKFNCPSCSSSMRCMAKCLWAGTSRANCIKKCDCNNNNKEYPRLSDCKKCLVPCKCRCSA